MYKEIQMGSGTKSYMRKGFLIYEEMRKCLVISEEAVSHIWLCTRSLLDSLVYEENFLIFLSVYHSGAGLWILAIPDPDPLNEYWTPMRELGE